jgi:hypothetical protein
MRYWPYLIIFVLTPFFVQSQTLEQRQAGWFIQANIGVCQPQADWSKRFGTFGEAGVGFGYKTASGWLFGLEGAFLFGNKVKEDPLYELRTSEGFVISQNGTPSSLTVQQRGLKLPWLKAGKIFHKTYGRKASVNSGYVFQLGGTYLQHIIHYQKVSGGDVGQLRDEYKKGYDRLCSGFALTESLGYMYLSNKRGMNFYAGLECMQGFTKSQRIDFNTQTRDNSRRLDMSIGFKVAWILPLLKRDENEEFYF